MYLTRFSGHTPINNYWTLMLREILSVIEKHHLTLRIPEDIEKTVGTRENLFNAATYWKDWDAILGVKDER
jgi:hypothetical protein